MPVTDKDYVIRLVKQGAEMFARLLKLIEKHEYQQALAAMQSGYPGLLGLDYAPLNFADPKSAADLLGDRHRLKIFAQLLSKEAEVYALMEDTSRAQAKREQALKVWLEAFQRGAALDPDSLASVAALKAQVPAASLGDSYPAWLAKLPG